MTDKIVQKTAAEGYDSEALRMITVAETGLSTWLKSARTCGCLMWPQAQEWWLW